MSHPVHIVDGHGDISPSAFIPFCSYGGNLSLVGRKVDIFQDPVCSAFTEKIINDQLCYEIDVNRFRDDVDWEKSLHSGLSLILDTNDEYDVRKLLADERDTNNIPLEDKLNAYDNFDINDKFTIFLKTISKCILVYVYPMSVVIHNDPSVAQILYLSL